MSLYPNNGITWDNHGGTVVFRGNCILGNDSYVSFGPKTTVDIGYEFRSYAGLKLASYHRITHRITFHHHVVLGWGCLCMDTNFHSLYDMEYLPLSYWIILPIQLVVGTAVFFTLCKLFKMNEYKEIMDILKNRKKK